MAPSELALVVFDCDGTLVDSQRTIVECMNRAFAGAGQVPPGRGVVLATVGLPLEEAIATLLSAGDGNAVDEVVSRYRTIFFEMRSSPDFEEPLFEGAVDALEALSEAGYLLGMATGKSRRGLVATLERQCLERFFLTMKTADDGPGKPSPGILLDAMRDAGVLPSRTVVVGDTTFDIGMAVNAGARAIGVSWGYHPASELREAGADAIVDSFHQLAGVVEQILGPA